LDNRRERFQEARGGEYQITKGNGRHTFVHLPYTYSQIRIALLDSFVLKINHAKKIVKQTEG